MSALSVDSTSRGSSNTNSFLSFANQLNKSVKAFLDHLTANSIRKDLVMENLFFTPETPVRDIFEQLMYTGGQLLWVESGHLKGMISHHDLLGHFID